MCHGTISDRRPQKHKLHAPKYRICVYLNTYIERTYTHVEGADGNGMCEMNGKKRTAIKPTNNNSNNNNNTRNDCQNALRRHQHRQNTEFRILLHYTPEHYKSKASFIENIESAELERERERAQRWLQRKDEREEKTSTGGLIFISFFIDGLLIPNSFGAVAVAAGCWRW